MPRGASSPQEKQEDFQQGPQLIFWEGVGWQHLLLADGEGTVGMIAHHAAQGENNSESGHPLLLSISLSVGLWIYFSFSLPPSLPPASFSIIHEQDSQS